jgi:hypothetical protein
MSNNPLTSQSYINKDFQTIYPELLDLVKKLTYKWDPTISNESDPGVLLIKLNALIADKNNYNIDKNTLECFPESVTQYENAYKLYNQLGYTMRWYQSAKGEISFQWDSEKIEENGVVFPITVPQFTMVTDEDKEIVYTTLSDCRVSTDGSVATVESIQGVIRDYTIGSDILIRPAALDYRNRLYFPISNVAENGIFISDSHRDSKNEYDFNWIDPLVNPDAGWKSVENLYIQPMGTKCYKFGIDQSNNTCYIEFPEDITNLIGEGIFVKYIQSDGESGNISAKVISQFYDDVEIQFGDSTVSLTQNMKVGNNGSINNGKDTESIDDAYINYKRYVGTFETLVTLRDYLNYIVNDEFEIVSNGVVSDRTNDIQSSYKIVTTSKDTTTIEPVVVGGASPEMSAFDLKTYFLEYSKWPKFDSSTDVASQKIDFKKAYDKSFKFQLSSDTTAGDSDTTNNPLDTPDIIKTYYQNAKRIEHDFIPKIGAPMRPLFFKNKFKLNMTIIPNNAVTQAQADDIEKNVYEAVLKNLASNKISFGEGLSYERVYDICNNADNRIKAVALDSIEYVPYAVVYIDSDTLNDIKPYVYALREDGEELELKEGLNEIPVATKITGESESDMMLLNEYLALDVCAKNVLMGTTPLYHPDMSFTRNLEQRDIDIVKKIEKITTNSEITFSGMSTNNGDFANIDGFDDILGNNNNLDDDSKILPNEALMLYAPNLREVITYAQSIKYIYYTLPTYVGPDEECIPPHTDYMLDRGQVLFAFWKTEDSKDAPYQYAKYGEGTILKATSRINKSKDPDYNTICNSLESSGYEGEGQILGTLNDLIYNIGDTLLSSTKTIVIKELNQVTLDDTHNYCYWITNNTIENDQQKRYVLNLNYVEPIKNTIDRSYQSGLVYVANFEWPAKEGDVLSHKGLNDEKTLTGDEKIYILEPTTSVISYNARNATSGEKYEAEHIGTNYVIKDIITKGTIIKCTGNIYKSESDGIFDQIESLVTGKETVINTEIPWGSLRTSFPNICTIEGFVLPEENVPEDEEQSGETAEGSTEAEEEVTEETTITHGKEAFIQLVDNYSSQNGHYRISCIGDNSWECIELNRDMCVDNKPIQSVTFTTKKSEDRNAYDMLYQSTNENGQTVEHTLWTAVLAYGYQPKKYDYFELSIGIDGTDTFTFYHSGNDGAGESWVPSTDKLADKLNYSPQYVLRNGYRIDIVSTANNHTNDGTFEYVLKSGEYFFYTDIDKKRFEMLSDGTKISIKKPNITDVEKQNGLSFSVKSIELSNIQTDRLSAFDTNSWHDFVVNNKEKDAIITITENQILMLGEGTYVRVALDSITVPHYTSDGGWSTLKVYDENCDSLKIDSSGVRIATSDKDWNKQNGALSNYTIQYRPSASDSWEQVPKSIHPDLSWDAYMILNINSGPRNPQKLDGRHNQTMEIRHKDSAHSSNPIKITSDTSNPVYVQTSVSLNISGGTNVDVTGVNIDNEVVYMDLMKYTEDAITGLYECSDVGFPTIADAIQVEEDDDSFKVTISNFIQKEEEPDVPSTSVPEGYDKTYIKELTTFYPCGLSSNRINDGTGTYKSYTDEQGKIVEFSRLYSNGADTNRISHTDFIVAEAGYTYRLNYTANEYIKGVYVEFYGKNAIEKISNESPSYSASDVNTNYGIKSYADMSNPNTWPVWDAGGEGWDNFADGVKGKIYIRFTFETEPGKVAEASLSDVFLYRKPLTAKIDESDCTLYKDIPASKFLTNCKLSSSPSSKVEGQPFVMTSSDRTSTPEFMKIDIGHRYAVKYLIDSSAYSNPDDDMPIPKICLEFYKISAVEEAIQSGKNYADTDNTVKVDGYDWQTSLGFIWDLTDKDRYGHSWADLADEKGQIYMRMSFNTGNAIFAESIKLFTVGTTEVTPPSDDTDSDEMTDFLHKFINGYGTSYYYDIEGKSGFESYVPCKSPAIPYTRGYKDSSSQYPRCIYPYFDLKVKLGYVYQIEYEAGVSNTKMCVEFYNKDAIAKVDDDQDYNNTTDMMDGFGWHQSMEYKYVIKGPTYNIEGKATTWEEFSQGEDMVMRIIFNNATPLLKKVKIHEQYISELPDTYWSDKTAMFFGDSITEKNQHYTEGYHYHLTTNLGLANTYDENMKSPQNKGQSSFTLADIYDRLCTEASDWKENSTYPDLIVIAGGVNDITRVVPLGDMNSAPTELGTWTFKAASKEFYYTGVATDYDYSKVTTYGSIKAICQKLKEIQSEALNLSTPKFVHLLVVTNTYQERYPTSQDGNTDYYSTRGQEVRTAMLKVCRDAGIPCYNNYDNSGITHDTISTYTVDKCHWNDATHKKVAGVLQTFILNNLYETSIATPMTLMNRKSSIEIAPVSSNSGTNNYYWALLRIPCDLKENTILPIEFMKDYENIKSFNIVSVGDNGTTITSNHFIHNTDAVVNGNKIRAGIYYYKVTEDTKQILIQCGKYDEQKVSFYLNPLFTFNYEDKLIDNDKSVPQSLLEQRISLYNVDNKFNYTYEPLEDVIIYNPLDPKTYFNSSHFCNKFTIPQISEIKIKTMNKRS